MKIILNYVIPIGIIILAAFLRFNNLSYRAPFDWDQNRDYQEVAKISSGKPTLIGPVARGEGGFFLGPLYYYLLTPSFVISGGDPIALPVTSVVLDILTIGLILYLGKYLGNTNFGYVFALIYALSPSMVDASLVSWNVALLPLWVIAMLLFLIKPKYKSIDLLLGGLLLGSSWHIHAALIPLAPILFLARSRSISLFSIKSLWLVTGYLLMLSPLILFDIRHVGLQSNLIVSMVTAQGEPRAALPLLLDSVLSRFGKNLSSMFGGPGDLNLWLGIVGLSTSLVAAIRGNVLLRLSALAVIANITLVILLGSVGFPEYYLATATIGTLLIITYILSTHWLGIVVAISLSLFLLATNSATVGPFTLGHKLDLVSVIAEDKSVHKVLYDLPYGRDSGLPILLKRSGAHPSSEGRVIYMISDKTDPSLFIEGEIASEVGWYGGFRLVKRELR